jgi:hypothetical protein
MPPAFVLSQDQTLRFALADGHPPAKLRALSHASLTQDMHAQAPLYSAAACTSLPLTNNVNEQTPPKSPPAEAGL